MDVIETNSNQIIKNPFFTDLMGLMKNPEFKHFYKKYFTDWNEIQTMIFFMKLYSTIEDEYNMRFNKQISDSDMSFVLQEVMNREDTRKYALTLFEDYKSSYDYKTTKNFRKLLCFSTDNQTNIQISTIN